jgi:hypothetical protein
VRSTVFIEARAMYRADGPEEMRSVGEVEFVQGMAAASASGLYGPGRAAAAIVAICLVGPIVEAFDRWDQTLQDGNDTEANVVAVAICVGLAMVVGTIVLARIRSLSLSPGRILVAAVAPVCSPASACAFPRPTISPPALLRI